MFWCFFGFCAILLDCWVNWDVSWNGKCHNPFIGSRYTSINFALCFLTTYLCLSNIKMHLSSHSCTIEMRLYWRVHVLPVLINHEVESGIYE